MHLLHSVLCVTSWAALLSARITAAHSFYGHHSIHHHNEIEAESYSISLLDARALPVGTCDADTPCVNGACCSKVRYSYLNG